MFSRALFFCVIHQVIIVQGYINPIVDVPSIQLDALLEPSIIKYPLADSSKNETQRPKLSQDPQSETIPSRYPDFPSFALDVHPKNENARTAKQDSCNNRKVPFSDIAWDDASRAPFWHSPQDTFKTPKFGFNTKSHKQNKKILTNRSYSKTTPYEDTNLLNPPMLSDLSPPNAKLQETFWASIPATLISFAGPYLMFPHLVIFMQHFIGSDPTILQNIRDSFGPGISILYGTFVSLTLSILYKRQQDIQNQAAKESSLLAMTTRNLLTLFKKDHALLVEAGQSAADQIWNLASGNRGTELMMIMYNDPYARMLELLWEKEDEIVEGQGNPQDFFTHCRDNIRELYRLRANRLSDESLALPQNHFFILTTLTILSLIGYTIQIVMQSTVEGIPLNDSSLVFGLLCSTYILFYNFATDLNDPFGGIYQVRRSATASHLLQIKWLIVNNPMLRGQVDFNKLQQDQEEDGFHNISFNEI